MPTATFNTFDPDLIRKDPFSQSDKQKKCKVAMAWMTTSKCLFLLWNPFLFLGISAFVPASVVWTKPLVSSPTGAPAKQHRWRIKPIRAESNDDPLDDLDEDRKQNLFQCLLRDLQIEGVPLLECDAFQAHTLQAALWTTMAELSEQDDAQKVCLVLEQIGVEALRTFCDDFLVLKSQQRLMQHLPELERFSLTVVGKGAGPAIVIETAAKTNSTTEPSREPNYDEEKVNDAMRAFIDRLIVGQGVCPYTKNSHQAPEGLEEVNVKPGQIGYRYCGFSEVCHVLSAFWNSICELLSVGDDKLSCVVLSMPAVGSGEESDLAAHNRFSAVAELISRSLCLYRGDDVFETLHFNPGYNRNLIHPIDQPAHGHLPPVGWLRSILRKNGNIDEAENLSNEAIGLSDFQRRAPFTSVVIKRAAHFEALEGSASGMVDLELENGDVVIALGIPCYASNVIKLANEGEEQLRAALETEISVSQ